MNNVANSAFQALPSDALAGRSVNRLTQAKNFRLGIWVQKLAETGAITSNSTYETLAVNASAELLFPVTRHNMVGVFEMLDMKLPEKPVTADVALLRRVAKLEAMVQALCLSLDVPCQL